MPRVFAQANTHAALVLSSSSRGRIWNLIPWAYGPDVAFLGCTMDHVFRRHSVDPSCIAIAKFLHGASCALSLSLANGTLFSDVQAFSPGFVVASRITGKPRIFISYRCRDANPRIDLWRRRVAETLLSSS